MSFRVQGLLGGGCNEISSYSVYRGLKVYGMMRLRGVGFMGYGFRV